MRSGLILSGWIRGLLDGKSTKAQQLKTLGICEASIRRNTDHAVCLVIFENGAAAFATGIGGSEIARLAAVIAYTVEKESGRDNAYQTCSFVVGTSESLIPQDIRRARFLVGNHQDRLGIFYLDGRMLSINATVTLLPPPNPV